MKTKHLQANVLAFAVAVTLLIPLATEAASTVTFDNQSGRPALVKLVGPTASSVMVENGKKESVSVAPGHYFIKVRYGAPGAYSYSKGDEFDVIETATTVSDFTITLHKVAAGNYRSKPISEAEFGAVDEEQIPAVSNHPGSAAASRPTDFPSSSVTLEKVGLFSFEAKDQHLLDLKIPEGGSTFVALRRSGEIVTGTLGSQMNISPLGELRNAKQLAVDRKGQWCAVATDRKFEIYDLKAKKRQSTKEFRNDVALVGFAQKGDLLAIDLESGSCLFWAFTHQKEARELAVKASPIRFLHGSDDLLGFDSRGVHVVKQDSGAIVQSFSTGGRSFRQSDLCSSIEGIVLVRWNDSDELDMPISDAEAIVKNPFPGMQALIFTSEEGRKWRMPVTVAGDEIVGSWRTDDGKRANHHGPKDLALYSLDDGARNILRLPSRRVARDADFIADGVNVVVLDMEIDRRNRTVAEFLPSVPAPPASLAT